MKDLSEAAPQPPKSEPIAYIEHHKGGDNLVWDNPGGKYSVLYTAPQPPSVPDVWRGLTDVEWMNIVNFDRAYSSYDKEGAVNEAVKRTEAKLKELNAAPTPAEAPTN